MSMRYLIRRQNPEKFDDIRAVVRDLDIQLGSPGENFQREVEQGFNTRRSAHYIFGTRKAASGWVWVCPTIELVAENEEGLFALLDYFKTTKPTHLAHLA